MIGGSVVKDHASIHAVVHADQSSFDSNGPRCRKGPDAEVVLHVVDDAEGVLANTVALVDQREDGEPSLLTYVEELPGLDLDPTAVVEQHDGAVGGHERPIGVLGEVLVPRRVQQVDPKALVVEVQNTRRDGDAAFLLHGEPVGSGVPGCFSGLHRPCEVNRTTKEQQLLGQRRLPGVRMADDREGTAASDLMREVGVAHLCFAFRMVMRVGPSKS